MLYLLGGEKYLPEDYWEHVGNQPATEFFNRWHNQPAYGDLPTPDYYMGETISLQSNILGTHFTFESKNASPGIEICEMIVAALEAYLSTAISMKIYGKVPEFKVVIEEKPELISHIELDNKLENGRSIKVVYKQFNPHLLTVEAQKKISEALTNLVIRIIAETVAFPDPEMNLKELMVDQRVDQRSFNFSSPLIMLGNVLGHNPRRSISQWITEDDKTYPFDGVASKLEPIPTAAGPHETIVEATNNADEADFNDAKGHQHVKTLSVINEQLWQGHVWRGFAFAVDPNPHSIQSPTLYLMFDDRQKAVAIFEEWRERFGDKAGENIKISILKGIDANNPYWYKGLISSNVKKQGMINGNTLILMTKISTMTPTNPGNLEGFLHSYARFGYFTLAPFFIDVRSGKSEPLNEWGFPMNELSIRNAWEVGLNELEMTAIDATENPVIPEGVTNAPVLKVIKMKLERKF